MNPFRLALASAWLVAAAGGPGTVAPGGPPRMGSTVTAVTHPVRHSRAGPPVGGRTRYHPLRSSSTSRISPVPALPTARASPTGCSRTAAARTTLTDVTACDRAPTLKEATRRREVKGSHRRRILTAESLYWLGGPVRTSFPDSRVGLLYARQAPGEIRVFPWFTVCFSQDAENVLLRALGRGAGEAQTATRCRKPTRFRTCLRRADQGAAIDT